MGVLTGPWADLALLLRQTVTQADKETDSFLPLCLLGLVLFLSVCLLLLQLALYLSWKLREVEAELSEFPQDRGAIYRPVYGSALPRRRRSFGSHSYT